MLFIYYYYYYDNDNDNLREFGFVYDRNLGDARVKVGSEREAASPPNRRRNPGEIPAKSTARKIDSFSIGNSRGGSPFLRPELALPRGKKCFSDAKHSPIAARDLAVLFSAKIGTASGTFFEKQIMLDI